MDTCKEFLQTQRVDGQYVIEMISRVDTKGRRQQRVRHISRPSRP